MKKDFDCVEMKRTIQARIYDQIANLTDAERTVYFKRQATTGSLADKWKEIEMLDRSRRDASRDRRTG